MGAVHEIVTEIKSKYLQSVMVPHQRILERIKNQMIYDLENSTHAHWQDHSNGSQKLDGA